MVRPTVDNTVPIILAAGKGRRMGSIKNKCLLKAGGKTLLEWTLHTLNQLEFPNTIIVTRSTDTGIENLIRAKNINNVSVVSDPFFLGAGHGLFVGTTIIKNPEKYKYILCLYGDDSFLLKPKTLLKFISHPCHNSPIKLMSVEKRLISKIGGLRRDKKGSPNGFYTREDLEKLGSQSAEIVCGTFLFKFDWLKKHFHNIVKSEDSGELILTSLISTAYEEDTPASVFKLTTHDEWNSVNTKEELKNARLLKRRQLTS